MIRNTTLGTPDGDRAAAAVRDRFAAQLAAASVPCRDCDTPHVPEDGCPRCSYADGEALRYSNGRV